MGRDGFSWLFLSLILVYSHFSVKTDLHSIFLSLCETSLPFFLLFYLLPSACWDCWIGCCGSTCPRLLSGTNFKKQGWGKKRKNIEWREREREKRERGSCSTTEPLQLFKWPLSLCTCSLRLVWILKWLPPKRQISRRWSPRRDQRLSVLDSLHPHHSSWWTGDYLCNWQHDFEGRKYSRHVWPKFHERQAEGLCY